MDIKLKIYNEECLKLANSMYLKFGLHALAIERRYTGSTKVDPDKTKWLQYRNMAGLYHVSNPQMTIKSLDTFQDIIFDREVLKSHPTTFDVYSEFGTHFDNLVAKYPSNEVLIKGILYGRSIDEVIDMPDFHIVGYNKSLVDVQEHDLIGTLNGYLNIAGTRAGCPDYIESNNNYPTAILAFIAMGLTPLIKRVRFQNSMSYNANTFYIWSNINSVVNLDKYRSVLSYDDVMYLFKNIRRLKSGMCSKNVFKEVLSTIVTPKMIGAYNLRSKALLTSMDMANITIDAEWDERNILDDDTKATTIETVISSHSSRSKRSISDPKKDLTNRLFGGYNSNTYPEITLYDNREREGEVRETILHLDYAFLFSGSEVLTKYYEVVRPDTGETLTLRHKEWLTLYMRIKQIQYGTKTDTIQSWATHQLYNRSPVAISTLVNGGLLPDVAKHIIDIMGTYPLLKNDIAVCDTYIKRYIESKSTVVSILDRSVTKTNSLTIGKLNDEIFKSYLVSLYPEQPNYIAWMDELGVSVDSMSPDTLRTLEYNILTRVIGVSGDSAESLVNMMGSMLHKFTSYKTNITQKASDKITLALSSRPTWLEVADDKLGVNTYITVSPTLLTIPEYNVSESIDVTSVGIKTSMQQLTLQPKVSTLRSKSIGVIDDPKPLINISTVQVDSRILE